MAYTTLNKMVTVFINNILMYTGTRESVDHREAFF